MNVRKELLQKKRQQILRVGLDIWRFNCNKLRRVPTLLVTQMIAQNKNHYCLPQFLNSSLLITQIMKNLIHRTNAQKVTLRRLTILFRTLSLLRRQNKQPVKVQKTLSNTNKQIVRLVANLHNKQCPRRSRQAKPLYSIAKYATSLSYQREVLKPILESTSSLKS